MEDPQTAFQTEIALLDQEISAILGSVQLSSSFRLLLRRYVLIPAMGVGIGARLRCSLLPFVVCAATGGRYDIVAPVAAAIEFSFASGDVFDDVEDEDLEDFASMQSSSRFHAVNVGTALLMLAQEAVARLGEKDVDPRAVMSVARAIGCAGLRACDGQYYDLLFESQVDVSQEMYFRMVELKSASLVECACRVGALLATNDADTIRSYSLLGHNAGVAAQITNDAVALRSAASADSDIRRRKKTLPAIYGLTQAQGADQKLLHDWYAAGQLATSQAVEAVREVLVGSGAVHYCLVVAELYKERALRTLEQLGAPDAAKDRLRLLLGL